MKIMGIDIGTTTVSIVLTDTETGSSLQERRWNIILFCRAAGRSRRYRIRGRSMRSSENFSQRCRENMECRMGLDLRDRCMGC